MRKFKKIPLESEITLPEGSLSPDGLVKNVSHWNRI